VKAGAAFGSSARREAGLLRARPFDLAMISWVPLALALLLCWTFAAGLPTRLPIGVRDDDHSALSRQLQRLLDAAPGLQVAQRYQDGAAVARALRAGEVYAVLEIPGDFSRTVKSGQAGRVALLHNAQFATHSGLIQRDVRSVVGTLSAAVEVTAREKRGQSELGAKQGFEPLRTALTAQFNTALNYEQFLATALMPALLHVLAMVAGAWAVGRELRDGSVARWSEAAAQPLAALAAKLAWPLLSLNLVNLLAWLWLTLARGWVPAGSLPAVLALHAAMLALYLALGALVALASRSLRTALSAAGFITAPAFAFSGIAFPLVAMPASARAWAEALPLTWVLQAQVSVLQLGAAPTPALGLALLFAAIAGTMLVLAAPLLHRATADPAAWGKR